MRKVCFAAALALLLLITGAAMADTFSFSDIAMTLDLPAGVYETQLSPGNLAANEAFITAQGQTIDALQEEFTNDGVLLMAYDKDNDRVFVLTAVSDEQGKKLFNINEQTPATRATYRAGHANGSYCGALGYKFETCEWKDFGGSQGRFLMLKYVLRKDDAVAYRGLWRRTVRNGYTITLDMRVMGRQVKSGDIKALNKIQDTVAFTQDRTVPSAPQPLIITAAPPEETNSSAFTVKGTAKPGATITAALTSFSSPQSIIYTATVDNAGKFTMPVTLPREDYYFMAIVSEYGGEMESQTEYAITYDDRLLPVSLTSDFPTAFTENTFKYTGVTLSGVKVQLIVNGKNVTKTTGNNKTFSFTVDTSEETDYFIEATFTKKNFDTRVFTYEVRREMNDEQRREKARKDAVAPAYATLSQSTDRYTGRVLKYAGYITEIKQVTESEWSLTFALKRAEDKYSDIIMLTADAAPAYAVGDKVTLYATGAGNHHALVDGKDVVYPLCTVLFFDAI